jgi:hypothetical protein
LRGGGGGVSLSSRLRDVLVGGFAVDGIGCYLPFGSRGSLHGAVGAEGLGGMVTGTGTGTGTGVVLAIVVLCGTVWYCVVLCRTVWYSVGLCGTCASGDIELVAGSQYRICTMFYYLIVTEGCRIGVSGVFGVQELVK